MTSEHLILADDVDDYCADCGDPLDGSGFCLCQCSPDACDKCTWQTCWDEGDDV